MNQRGFTVIELLMVVGIVGIIGVSSSIAINAARSRQRDAVRLSDVRQLQSVLESYFLATNRYPDGISLRLGEASGSACLSASGFQSHCSSVDSVYLPSVPREDQKGISGSVQCGVPREGGYCYTVSSDGMSYRLGFELEHGIAEIGIVSGAQCLAPEIGIRSGVCDL